MLEKQIPQNMKKEYPFKSQSLTLSTGHQYHYIDEGQGDAIIMVHGNPTWSFYYRNLIKHFSKNNRVIVPDHIGCGLSDKPQNYSYTLKNHIKNIQELIRSLKITNYKMIVHDWGGAIGMGLATLNPDVVQKIVLLNTAAFTDINIPKRISICKLPFIGEKIVRHFNAFAWPATFMAVKRPIKKEIKNGYLYPYNNFKNRIATARFVKDIPMDEHHPTWDVLKEIEENLPSLKCPKLILWGAKDFCFTIHFYNRWKKIYPTASTHLYPEGGHYIIEDEAEDTQKRIEVFFNE